METRQRQVLDAFERVRTFLDAHPASSVLLYASTQYRGRAESRAETRRQADQVELLVDQHIRPIVTISRAQIEPTSDVGLPAGLRMPKLPLNASQLVTKCDGAMEAAQAHEALLIAGGADGGRGVLVRQ